MWRDKSKRCHQSWKLHGGICALNAVNCRASLPSTGDKLVGEGQTHSLLTSAPGNYRAVEQSKLFDSLFCNSPLKSQEFRQGQNSTIPEATPTKARWRS